MPISLRHQPLVQVPQISLQVCPIFLLCNAIHAHRRPFAESVVCAGQKLLVHQLGERVKLPSGFPFRSLGYPLESW